MALCTFAIAGRLSSLMQLLNRLGFLESDRVASEHEVRLAELDAVKLGLF